MAKKPQLEVDYSGMDVLLKQLPKEDFDRITGAATAQMGEDLEFHREITQFNRASNFLGHVSLFFSGGFLALSINDLTDWAWNIAAGSLLLVSAAMIVVTGVRMRRHDCFDPIGYTVTEAEKAGAKLP